MQQGLSSLWWISLITDSYGSLEMESSCRIDSKSYSNHNAKTLLLSPKRMTVAYLIQQSYAFRENLSPMTSSFVRGLLSNWIVSFASVFGWSTVSAGQLNWSFKCFIQLSSQRPWQYIRELSTSFIISLALDSPGSVLLLDVYGLRVLAMVSSFPVALSVISQASGQLMSQEFARLIAFGIRKDGSTSIQQNNWGRIISRLSGSHWMESCVASAALCSGYFYSALKIRSHPGSLVVTVTTLETRARNQVGDYRLRHLSLFKVQTVPFKSFALQFRNLARQFKSYPLLSVGLFDPR